MNMSVKILDKIPAIQIQQYIKNIIYQDQVGFIPEIQDIFNTCKLISVIHCINKLENEHHMIISVDAEKDFDKIQHPFMIKALQRVGIEGNCLNIIKTICMTNSQLTSYSRVKI